MNKEEKKIRKRKIDNDDNIDFSHGLAEVVFNNYELGNFNNSVLEKLSK